MNTRQVADDEPPTRLLNSQARRARPSVIRDILEHARRPGMISLAGGIPDPATFAVDAIATATAELIRATPEHLQYGTTQGEPAAREVFADQIGTPTDPDDVLVTTGSQQGLDLLARTLIDPGDTVVVAEAEYLGAVQAFGWAGARFEPLPIDAAGLDIEMLAGHLRRGLRPKLVYTVPHFHNPTGGVLSAERGAALAELAERYGFLVVEDDPYRELWFDWQPDGVLGPGSAQVVRLRSSSKILAPGLRIGWLTGPPWLVRALVVAKQAADLHTSTLTQAVAARVLSDRQAMGAQIERGRALYRRRRDALVPALDVHLGSRHEVQLARVPSGGMFCWVELPGVDTTALLARAVEHGVAFVPGSAFATRDAGLASHLRLSFALVDDAAIDEGLERLARSLR